MKKGINQIYQYMMLICKNLHYSALKTLSMTVYGFLLAKKPITAEIARKLNYKQDFEVFYQRIWRFLNSGKFTVDQVCSDISEHLLTRLQTVTRITIALDWTPMVGFNALVASIPVGGRAKPIFFKLWEDYDLKDRMTQLELELIEQLLSVVPRHLRHKIVFVADRGFAKTELMHKIEDLGAKFVIRLPRGIYVAIEGKWTLVEDTLV